MDLNRWINNSINIQAIPAPTFHEGERAEYVFNAFKALNLRDISMDDDRNVYARLPGGESERPLVISAHLDTVFPLGTDLTHQRKGSQIIGPGIGDNAVAVGVLLELAHDFNRVDLPRDIWLVANVGEEGLGNLKGMKKVVGKFGEGVLAYLVLEGMALGHIYHRSLPIHRYRIAITTPGGHAWIHAGRVSAIHAICQLGAKLSRIHLSGKRKWSLNIGRINGGTSINTIAPEASLELDLRAEDSDVLQQLDQLVRKKVEEISAAVDRVRIEEIGNRPGGGIPAAHPLVDAAIQALRNAGVKDPQLEIGSTDASFPLSNNIPAICIGLTYGSGAHSLEEFIEIPSLKLGYQALRDTIDACFDWN